MISLVIDYKILYNYKIIKINELDCIRKGEGLMISTKFITYSILNSYIYEDGDQE